MGCAGDDGRRAGGVEREPGRFDPASVPGECDERSAVASSDPRLSHREEGVEIPLGADADKEQVHMGAMISISGVRRGLGEA